VHVPDWFRRFGDIPGVSFAPPPGLDRRHLAGHDATPEVHVYDFGDKRRETLWWPAGEGGSSASPVHARAFGDASQEATDTLLRRVAEGLELPGEPSDYHFLIQGCALALWNRRRAEPEVLPEVERLCWLDLQLVQSRPEAVTDEYSEQRRFYSIPTFHTLIELYQREGFLRDALEVAELGVRCGQSEAVRDELLERMQAVEAEADAEQP
jgi:hypothetical protein